MTGTFTNNGNGTYTVTFSYTATTAKAIATVTDAAHYFWLQGIGANGGAFEALTNQQKLNIVDLAVKQYILSAARSYRTNEASADAIADALALADTELGLNGS